MASAYQNLHWKVFASIPHVEAGRIGSAPSTWTNNHNLGPVPKGRSPLPLHQLDRATLRSICQDSCNSVLYSYLCVMAWGGQGRWRNGRDHVEAAWNARKKIKRLLTVLRSRQSDRQTAYNLFLDAGKIPGIGPAYFTKLMYFFSPTSDCYIMDQWTAKSVNLLTQSEVVRIASNRVSDTNNSINYLAYCREVDRIASLCNVNGDQAEEMLMSKRGQQWRVHVNKHWPQ